MQVSLGEIIMHPHGRVHAAINSKRVDLLVTDEQFNALIAIEIDGSGHHLTNYSHINDEGKTLALRSAGIPLLRVAARQDGFNHGVAVVCAVDEDAVVAGDVAAVFAPVGGEECAVLFEDELVAEVADDGGALARVAFCQFVGLLRGDASPLLFIEFQRVVLVRRCHPVLFVRPRCVVRR